MCGWRRRVSAGTTTPPLTASKPWDCPALCGASARRLAEPLTLLRTWAVCYPDLWRRMTARVRGATTAARYALTDLYGHHPAAPLEGVTWREWTWRVADLYPEPWRSRVALSLRTAIELHQKKTRRPFPEEPADPMTGVCWRAFAQIALKGDFKG